MPINSDSKLFACIGGLSGAVGKVSGVLGDAAAKLTMDDEYQEQRRRRAGGADSIGRSVGGAAKVCICKA